jgi:hypothetical protein
LPKYLGVMSRSTQSQVCTRTLAQEGIRWKTGAAPHQLVFAAVGSQLQVGWVGTVGEVALISLSTSDEK